MEKIYTQAEQYFADLIEDIDAAQSSVDLEAYIYENDKIGKAVTAALVRAAQRGISVRLLVDGVGAADDVDEQIMHLQNAGGDGRIYHPLPWRFWHWTLAANRQGSLSRLWHFLTYINRRNHRKTVVIDRKIVWLGSLNIAASHLPQNLGGEGWRDTGVRLMTENANEVSNAFSLAWQHSHVRAHRSASHSGQFRLNYTRGLRRLNYKVMLRHIGQAKNRVWITNAYFVPESKLLKALAIAARRGIDVRILLPAFSDVEFMPWTASRFYHQLLAAGVRIFEYEAGVLHAKTLVMDHWVTIGSSNLNQRSLRHDLEIDAVLHEIKTVKQVEQQFLHDQMSSREVKNIQDLPLPWWKRLIGQMALMIRYWL